MFAKMFRSTKRATYKDDLAGSAILSASAHGLILLFLLLDLPFPTLPEPEPPDLIEVELMVLPEEKAKIEEEKPVDQPEEQQAEDTQQSPNKQQTPKAQEAQPNQQTTQPNSLAQLASLVDAAKTTLTESVASPENVAPAFTEASECRAGNKPTASLAHINDIAAAAKTGPALAQVAVLAQEAGFYERSIKLYDAAIAAGLSKKSLAKAYNNRAAALRSLGRLERAIEDYNKAIKLKPYYAAAYYNQGLAFKFAGYKKHALANFSKSIQIDPYIADAWFQRGLIYAQNNTFEQAVNDFSHAISLNDCLAEAYAARAKILETLGDPRAQNDYQQAQALGIAIQ